MEQSRVAYNWDYKIGTTVSLIERVELSLTEPLRVATHSGRMGNDLPRTTSDP